MRILTQREQEFRWEGESSASREKLRIQYSSFFLDEEKFSIEEFVLIRNDDSVDPEDISNCYVGQIKELYDTGDKYEPHQAKVQWYSRVTELPPYTCKIFDQVYEHEVIEENRPHFSSTIDADTIFSKCEVHFLPLGADFVSFDAMLEECDIPTFFCRYKFSGKKLSPKVEKDGAQSEQNSPVPSKKSETASKEKTSKRKQTRMTTTPKNGTYVAMTTGTKEYPKVLIKRMDDRVLESQNKNVRIIVAQPDTMDNFANTFQNSLSLCSPAKTPQKGPFIHSLSSQVQEYPLCNVTSFTPSKSNSNEKTHNSSSPKKSALKKIPENTQTTSITPKKLGSNHRENETTLRSQSCTPKKTPKVETFIATRSCARVRNGTPKRLAAAIASAIITPSPVKSSKRKTPKRVAAIKDDARTPSAKSSGRSRSVSTPRSTNTVMSHVESPLKSEKTASKVASISPNITPKRSRSVATPRSANTVMSRVDSPMKRVKMPSKVTSISLSNTPKRSRSVGTTQSTNTVMSDVDSPSPMKRKKTPSKVAGVSPSKTPKSARRSINFSAVSQEVAVTRSGRKIKPVNYCVEENSDDERRKTVLSNTIKKSKLSRFIRNNYSDDSGSEFSSSSSSCGSEDDEPMSDGSLEEKKPRPPRSTKKVGVKSPRTSVKKISELNIPVRKTPLKAAENILEESRLRLHVAAVPKSLPCRGEEFSDIYSFVKSCLSAHTGGCMYISGVPGTGKTATVHEVIRKLEDEKEDGDVPLFTFVEVNGMWMTDPYQCYVHIFKSLTGKTIASQQAANLLEKRFTESGPKKEAVILLVDELDRLWTRKQTVMYNIFDWPSKKHSKLIVLAIANTMDLPERLMMNRISSRLGLTRKTFQPYNFRQLQEIIMSRIQELQVFDPDAVQFVARKVAAVSGDARRALDICRHATEVAERSQSSPKKKRKILVGMEHVDEAIQQMFSSPVIAAIKSSSKVAKLFLQGMLSEFTRTGLEETILLKVSSWITTTLKFEGIKPPSTTEISHVCSQLAASHLILVDNFQNDIYMKLRLSVSPGDVNYALTGKGLA